VLVRTYLIITSFSCTFSFIGGSGEVVDCLAVALELDFWFALLGCGGIFFFRSLLPLLLLLEATCELLVVLSLDWLLELTFFCMMVIVSGKEVFLCFGDFE
jgi:hypothetical protein